MESSSLLRHHHHHRHRHPPPLRCYPFSISTHSRYRFLHLRRRSFGPISARRFESDPRSNRNYNDDQDDYGYGDGTKRQRRRRTKQRRQWWFDDENESEPSMLNQVIDSLLFIKVLKSYGWLLPVVLLSILLTSGLTTFVLAFSIPLGFSFIILAFDKISAWLERNKRRQEDDQENEEEESQANRRRYRNNGSVHKGNSNSKFGGWDELIREQEEQRDRSSRPDQKAEEPKQELQSSIMQTRERELPLLSKLLVALFPFLATWTSLFR